MKVNEALFRLENDNYLLCSKCGEAIGEARLEALPYTDLCIDCASQN